MTITNQGSVFTPREVLLSPMQVGEWIGLSQDALAQLRYTGKGPRFRKLTAKAVRYLESDVQEWIDASARTITGQVA